MSDIIFWRHTQCVTHTLSFSFSSSPSPQSTTWLQIHTGFTVTYYSNILFYSNIDSSIAFLVPDSTMKTVTICFLGAIGQITNSIAWNYVVNIRLFWAVSIWIHITRIDRLMLCDFIEPCYTPEICCQWLVAICFLHHERWMYCSVHFDQLHVLSFWWWTSVSFGQILERKLPTTVRYKFARNDFCSV